MPNSQPQRRQGAKKNTQGKAVKSRETQIAQVPEIEFAVLCVNFAPWRLGG
jgi:hypothetical protein